MPPLPAVFPTLESLTAGLSAGLGGPVVVLDRERNVMTSTFPSEVVSCRLANGSERRVFCKYGTGHIRHRYGHRGGVGYEAAVYRDLLLPAGVCAPAYYGSHTDPATGEVWLFVEYLPGAARVNKSPLPGAMTLAAGWLGRFHRAFEGLAVPTLNVYDGDYYRGWAERTARFGEPRRDRFPWLGALCERFAADVVPELGRLPTAVIHGEFYPCNVLICGGAVRPIDWESAAVGPGEIDFASLVEKWPAAVVEECGREYRAARWPDGVPADFDRRLAAARMYWAFRWMGWRPEHVAGSNCDQYYAQLREAGAQLGLI